MAAPAGASPAHLQLSVTPRLSPPDTPLRIRLSGITPGQSVTLSATSVHARGVKWSSSSTYTAGPAGTVDPATTLAVGGSYSGVDPMGPVDFLNAALVPFAQDTVWPFGGLGT
ncbi:MAG TPA: acyl-CoA thioesterase/BAAT N-terminal domain-containing protein, partial [Acidimicrobiales bacterium]|nr:acyl-CoA thioesterase/BAAT N-terminal domain-containing protein [Acidimicrobiales bacterium]